MEFIGIDGLRADGRRAVELRRIKCELGALENVDGSAQVEMGLSKALATVVGPKAAADRSMQGSPVVVKCEYWMTPFSTGARRARGRADRHNMEMALLLETVVQQSVMQEALGRCQIEISVTVLEADGGAEPCAINAVMLALADAGIPMVDMAAACTAGYLESTYVLDMNHFEESTGCSRVFVAMQPNLECLTLVQMYNRLEADAFEKLLETARAGCVQVYCEMQAALNARVKELAIARGSVTT